MRCGCRRPHGGAPLPNARVVKDGTNPLPRVVVDQQVRDAFERVQPRVRAALVAVVGLWPLVLIMALTVALLWSAGYQDPVLGR